MKANFDGLNLQSVRSKKTHSKGKNVNNKFFLVYLCISFGCLKLRDMD